VREVLALMFVAACGRFGFDGRLRGAPPNNADAAPPGADGVPDLRRLRRLCAFAESTDMQAQPAFDLWIDDVIAANTPVSCAD
jgi:hypothetical protein